MASPSPEYLAESRTTELYVGLAIPIPILIVSTALRLWSELYLHRNCLKVDDILSILATVAIVGSNATFLQAPRYGLGRRVQTMAEEDITSLGKLIFIALQFYFFGNAGTKLSVLALYYRAFPSLTIRRVSSATAVVTILWFLATDFAWTFQCIPVQKMWNTMIDGNCLAAHSALYWQAGSNLGLDIWIFIMPLPLIAKMRMISTRQKLCLVFLFSVGLASCVLGAARIALLVQVQMMSPDFTWDGVPFSILSVWELVTALLCANLPIIYKPIAAGFRRARAMGLDDNEHAQAARSHGNVPPQGRSTHTWSRSRSRVNRALRFKRNMNVDVNLAYSIRLASESELGSGSSGTQRTGTGTVVGTCTASSETEVELEDVGAVTTTDANDTTVAHRRQHGHERPVS
ncbi:uncharacterized protein DSM5745_03874 [Aspergillus mulundensis]|uniref:Rhodopsin domain-containing protein n=1 Tax=Aspergillus mulundensis TaxID=1810919 RepID=A0A3D8SCP5_9EURO|nr:hypothetical protein DSM5745_03874 [Aspergillus mulundensis]RDW83548.1 hypothetical protein DSM5745_03874 [Aspergillus mulundensis]